jgi:hypothetical protein
MKNVTLFIMNVVKGIRVALENANIIRKTKNGI